MITILGRTTTIRIAIILALAFLVQPIAGFRTERFFWNGYFVAQFIQRLLDAFCRLGVTIACTDGNTAPPTQSPGPTGGPLSINDFQYIGAFRLHDVGEPGSNFAVGVMAFHPDRKSIFIVGHAQYQTIAEFPVVDISLLSSSTNIPVAELPSTKNPLQSFAPVFDLAKGGSSNTYNPDGLNTITGLLYLLNQSNGNGGSLLFNAEDFYDTFPTATQTTGLVGDATKLNTTVTRGFYQMQGDAKSAGYMGTIPPEYQSKFANAKYYTGWSSVYSILSRYSLGPTLFTFDPYQIANQQPPANISAKAYLNYAYETIPLGGFDDATAWEPCTSSGPFPPSSPLWNPLSRAVFGFFVPNYNTFVAIGSTAGLDSGIGYKGTQENGVACGGPCPFLLNDYDNYYWMYDIDDVIAADHVYDPIPYAYGKWDIPYDRPSNTMNGQPGLHRILGGTIDDDAGILYIALEGAGKVSDYDFPPLIVAYALPK